MGGSILGAAVKRVEDPRFITGQGHYLSNLEFRDALWMLPVRSPAPHARLRGIEVAEAEAAPGVVGVYRADDLDLGPMPLGAPDLSETTRRPPIARDRVRFVGDIVAVVVAEEARAAADAAELVWADLDPLPTVATPDDAIAEGAPLLFPELGTNTMYHRGDHDETVLDDAEVVIETRVVNQRVAAVPMETNGAVAVPATGGGLEIWLGTQSVHGHRRALAAVLGMDPSRIQVRAPDVGGGFGAKISLYPEQALCAAIALDLGRVVRWEETRRENFQTMTQGRAQIQDVRLGATSEGRITGLSIRVTQDAGAYPLFGAYLPTFTRRMAAGPYRVPKLEFLWRSVVTNTTPVHAYRGAGRPEATLTLERALDQLAARLEIDPAELRRRNFVAKDQFPHVTVAGERYDSGDYQAGLDLALELGGYGELRDAQAERRRRGDGTELGIGLGSYVEITAGAGRRDWGRVEIDEDGGATIFSGTVSGGHSHETTFAQLLSTVLRIPISRIRYVQGDTDVIAGGGGTMASRSLQMSGTALLRAGERVIDKARTLFAFHAEAAVEDVVQFDDGRIGVIGVPASAMTLGEMAAVAADPANLPDGMEPGLDAEDHWEQTEATFPFGTHLSVVEVDTDTGVVRVLRHVACDDTGTILNRMVVDGQVHGGVAQGLGQALFEHFSYDGDANPLTGNLTTYLTPTAGTVPAIEVAHTQTPTTENPLGAKGIGEAGTIGSTPAVVNAVIDALSPYGVRHLDMPLTPWRVWTAINGRR